MIPTVDRPAEVERSAAAPTAAGPTPEVPPVPWFHRRAALVALVALAIGVASAVRLWPTLRQRPANSLTVSGRIEGRTVTIAPKDIQARVERLFADEGDKVVAGQKLAQLSAAQLDARYQTLDANIRAIEAQIQQASLDVSHTERSVAASISVAEAAVRGAEANLTRARALRSNAVANQERAQQLVGDRVISKSEFDQLDTTRRAADAEVAAAEHAVAQAESGLALARASGDTIELKRQQVRALEAGRRAAIAQRAEAEATIAEREIVAPSSGIVLARTVEVGDVVAPASPMFTIVDLQRLYVKVYVPEPDVPKLMLGALADVKVDAYPDRVFHARVSRISDQAEFTPKNVETADERVKLVFGVELNVENPDGTLKPGMPADCTIRFPASPAPDSNRYDP